MPQDPPFIATYQPQGLLKSPTIPGFQQETDVTAYMPTPEMAGQAWSEQHASKPLWASILSAPDWAFGGQMLKGFLAGTGEDGLADNLLTGFRNNPLFAGIDFLFGTQLTDEKHFSDIRKNFGWSFGQDTIDTGVANFFINTAGEILLDPVSFWNPMGKIKGAAIGLGAGGRAAVAGRNAGVGVNAVQLALGRMAGHGTEDAARLLMTDMGNLIRQTETSQRALFIWGIPGVGQFVVQPFKSLDVTLSKALVKMGDFMQLNPLTRPMMKAFSTGYAPIPEQVRRGAALGAIRDASIEANIINRPATEQLARLMKDHGAMARDPEAATAVMLMNEYGLKDVDDLGRIETIVSKEGREVRQAADRFTELRDSGTDPKFTKLLADAESGDLVRAHQAALELYEKYPNVRMPESIRTQFSLPPRAGVEFKRPVLESVIERNVNDIVKPMQPPEVLPNMLEAPAGQAARVGEEMKVAGTSREVIVEQGESRVIDLFERLRETKGDDYLESLLPVAQEFKSIMKRLEMNDIVSGFLENGTTLYMPRVANPEAMRAIEKAFLTSVRRNFTDKGAAFAADFLKKRGSLDQLDTLTANHLFNELGTKFTNYRPLKEAFQRSGAEGVQTAMDRVWAPLRNLIMDKAPEAASFFDTNPFTATWKRIQSDIKLHDVHLTNRKLLDAGSPLVSLESKGSTMLQDWDKARAIEGGDPVVPVLMSQRGRASTTFGVGDMGDAMDLSFKNNSRARHALASQKLREQATQLLAEGKRGFDDLAKEWTDALDLTHDRVHQIATTDTWAVQSMKRNLNAYKDAIEDLKAARGPAYKEKVAAIQHTKERLEDLRRIIRSGRDDVMDVASKYREGINAGTADRQAMLRDVVNRPLTAEQTTEAVLLHRLEATHGVLPLDELQASYPQLAEKLLKNDPRVVFVRKDVYDGVWGKDGMLESLRRPDKIAEYTGMKWWGNMTHWWKSWTLLPPFWLNTRMRDYTTNLLLQAVEGGVGPKAMAVGAKDAFGLSQAFRKALDGDFSAIDAWKTIRDDGMTISGRDIWNHMQARGVTGSPMLRDEMFMLAQDGRRAAGIAPESKGFQDWLQGIFPPVFGGKRAGSPQSNPLIQMGTRFAEFGDNHARLTGVLGRWHGGAELDEAVQKSVAAQYDPTKVLTSFERHVMRRLIPFYGFTKFALKKTMDLYFSKPGVVSGFEKIWRTANEAAGVDPVQFDSVLPDFIKNNLGVPYEKTEDGVKFSVLGNYIPLGEFTQLAQAFDATFKDPKNGPLGYILNKLDPFAKGAIEQLWNYDAFSHRQIETFPGEHDEMFGITMSRRSKHALGMIRFLNELDRLNVINAHDFKTMRIAAGDAVDRGMVGTRKELPFLDRVLTGAFGALPRGYMMDMREETRQAAAQQQAQFAMLKGKLRKRVEDQGKPTKQEDIAVIQQEMAELLAKAKDRQDIEQKFNVSLLRK